MLHPLAGRIAPHEQIINLPKLLADYYTAEIKAPVAFGTSGHRGSSFKGSFNEAHVIAVVQAIAEYRRGAKITGPLFLAYDTHALSECAFRSAIEVLVANEVDTIIHQGGEFTPTPVLSRLIIEHNRNAGKALADGIIITPSHNPPSDGGIKYNPPHGGPADVDATNWIEKRSAELIAEAKLIKRKPYKTAIKSTFVNERDFISPFVEALGEVVNFAAIKSAGLKLAADPLGGSGVHYWEPIAERWGLNITVVNKVVDASFSFVPLDADGVVRMDCSSAYAMSGLINNYNGFDLAFGNDPDFDRHGIVSDGNLMNSNHFLAVSIDYLLANRPNWPSKAKVGKTLVSSSIIDRVVEAAGRELYETPVGFKWFVEGLSKANLVFGGEESAGATFLQKDGSVWTSDKDGFSMALLAAEIMAVSGKSPAEYFKTLTERFGRSDYIRIDSSISEAAKESLKTINSSSIIGKTLGNRKVVSVLSSAPGNQAPVGGLKVILDDSSWFALRPSGTEAILKLYVESFSGPDMLKTICEEAQGLIFGKP